MNLPRAVRSIAEFQLPAIKVKAWSVRILATAFCLSGALYLTATRIETTRLSYKLDEAHKQRQKLENDVARLQIEHANLSRPQRIAELARRMGLTDPKSGQIIVMDD